MCMWLYILPWSVCGFSTSTRTYRIECWQFQVPVVSELLQAFGQRRWTIRGNLCSCQPFWSCFDEEITVTYVSFGDVSFHQVLLLPCYHLSLEVDVFNCFYQQNQTMVQKKRWGVSQSQFHKLSNLPCKIKTTCSKSQNGSMVSF